MAYSSIFGADRAPAQPSGRSNELLGPSDNTDSGSDAVGTHEALADSDAAGTGERGAVFGDEAREGADILPDQVMNMDDEPGGEGSPQRIPGDGNGFPEADPDGQEFTDLDNDDSAEAGDAGDDR